MSQQGYNLVYQLLRRTKPQDIGKPTDLYQTKKLVAKLGLKYNKIDYCVNGCMLYYKANDSAIQCKFCGDKIYSTENSHGREKTLQGNSCGFYL